MFWLATRRYRERYGKGLAEAMIEGARIYMWCRGWMVARDPWVSIADHVSPMVARGVRLYRLRTIGDHNRLAMKVAQRYSGLPERTYKAMAIDCRPGNEGRPIVIRDGHAEPKRLFWGVPGLVRHRLARIREQRRRRLDREQFVNDRTCEHCGAFDYSGEAVKRRWGALPHMHKTALPERLRDQANDHETSPILCRRCNRKAGRIRRYYQDAWEMRKAAAKLSASLRSK